MTSPARVRPRVRVKLPGERSWAEHVSGSTYRSLNDTLSNVMARATGREVNLRWGHLFEAVVVEQGPDGPIMVEPVCIVGYDPGPR